MAGVGPLLFKVILVSACVGRIQGELQDTCASGTVQHTDFSSSGGVLLAYRPSPHGQASWGGPCVCNVTSPSPFTLKRLLHVPLHSAGAEPAQGHVTIGVGNQTFNSSSLLEGRCLQEQYQSGSNSSTSCQTFPPNLTLSLGQPGMPQAVLLLSLLLDTNDSSNNTSQTGDSLNITCEAPIWTTTSPSPVTTPTLASAPVSSPPDSSAAAMLQQMQRVTNGGVALMAVAAVVLVLALALLLGLFCYRYRMLGQGHWGEGQAGRLEKTELGECGPRGQDQPASRNRYEGAPTAKGGSVTAMDSAPVRKQHAAAHSHTSLLSNLSNDVFLTEEGPGGSASPQMARQRPRYPSGGKDPPQPPASTPPHYVKTSGSSGGNTTGAAPAASNLHRPPAANPTTLSPPGSALQEEDNDAEWYGNLEVENKVPSRASTDDNIYEDPDSAQAVDRDAEGQSYLGDARGQGGKQQGGPGRSGAAAAAGEQQPAPAKQSVKIVQLKVRRVEQEANKSGSAGLPQVLESPEKPESPSPRQDEEGAGAAATPAAAPAATATGQQRLQPGAPQAPQDKSSPQAARGRRRDDVVPPQGGGVRSRSPTPLHTPAANNSNDSNAADSKAQATRATPTHSRGSTPGVSPLASRRQSQDSLDLRASDSNTNSVCLLFPESGTVSRASLEETREIADEEEKKGEEEEEEEVYQNYTMLHKVVTEEATPDTGGGAAVTTTPDAKSGPEDAVLVDNELYESSSPAQAQAKQPQRSSGLSPAQKGTPFTYLNPLASLPPSSPASSQPATAKVANGGTQVQQARDVPRQPQEDVLIDNILYESSSDLLNPAERL